MASIVLPTDRRVGLICLERHLLHGRGRVKEEEHAVCAQQVLSALSLRDDERRKGARTLQTRAGSFSNLAFLFFHRKLSEKNTSYCIYKKRCLPNCFKMFFATLVVLVMWQEEL